MDLLRKVSTKFISGLVKMLEDKNKRPRHILDNYESSFISRLVEIQEDKIHLAKWGYSGMFTRHILDNYESSFISRLVEAQEDKINFAERGYSNCLNIISAYSDYFDIASAYPIFEANDYQGVWEDEELYSDLDIYGNNNGREVFDDLRRRSDDGPFYYEDNSGSNSIICKNNILTFREEECVICKDAIRICCFLIADI